MGGKSGSQSSKEDPAKKKSNSDPRKSHRESSSSSGSNKPKKNKRPKITEEQKQDLGDSVAASQPSQESYSDTPPTTEKPNARSPAVSSTTPISQRQPRYFTSYSLPSHNVSSYDPAYDRHMIASAQDEYTAQSNYTLSSATSAQFPAPLSGSQYPTSSLGSGKVQTEKAAKKDAEKDDKKQGDQ